MAPLERPVGQRDVNGRHDCRYRRQTPGTELATGHLAVIGPHHQHTIAGQRGEVPHRRGMLPHAHIHRRCDQHTRIGGHQQRGGEIIGNTVGHLGHQVGRCRGHDDQIGRPAELDMAHLGLVGQIEKIAIDLFGGQGRSRQRRHEFLRRPGQDRHDTCPAATQFAHQVQRPVGRNAAADYQKYAFARKHVTCSFPDMAGRNLSRPQGHCKPVRRRSAHALRATGCPVCGASWRRPRPRPGVRVPC